MAMDAEPDRLAPLAPPAPLASAGFGWCGALLRMPSTFDDLAKYAAYYNEVRTHVTLGKDAPCTRAIERFGDIVAIRFLAGSAIDTLESSFQKRQARPSRPR